MNTTSSLFAHPRIPVIDLLNPRRQTRFFVLMLAIGLIATGSAMRWLGMPLWAATLLVLALLLPPAILKWRVDESVTVSKLSWTFRRAWGLAATGVLSECDAISASTSSIS